MRDLSTPITVSINGVRHSGTVHKAKEKVNVERRKVFVFVVEETVYRLTNVAYIVTKVRERHFINYLDTSNIGTLERETPSSWQEKNKVRKEGFDGCTGKVLATNVTEVMVSYKKTLEQVSVNDSKEDEAYTSKSILTQDKAGYSIQVDGVGKGNNANKAATITV